ncbi:MAG: hypothetical protein IPO07_09135 [Haliscomenobacter sp.]|nr:hypothetical protein [Haliscomenobacter sp.]MBK9488933.1 hypothetical protein [Haliscomenobacter sp.]
MHGIDKEIEGYKTKLDLLIDKKNRLDLAMVTAYDEEKKFGLQQQVDGLEGEIKSLQERIKDLEQQIPATPATTPGPIPPSSPKQRPTPGPHQRWVPQRSPGLFEHFTPRPRAQRPCFAAISLQWIGAQPQ